MYYNKTPAEAVRVAVPAGVFILKYARETAGGRSSALLPDQMIEKTARSSLSLNTGELSKFFTCDHLVALKIFVNCFLDNIIRKVPVIIRVRSQPVTCKLFVERRLSVPRFGVSISSPITILPFSSRPNSNLVSAIMIPRLNA